jgi:hypothetical protein
VLLGMVAVVLTGCATGAPVPPTYTQEELRVRCERQTGWWRPDGQFGGLCEYGGQM